MSEKRERYRRMTSIIIIIIVMAGMVIVNGDAWSSVATVQKPTHSGEGLAIDLLATIPVKGRASKTGYARTQYGDGWAVTDGCDTRNIIMHRDMQNVAVDPTCRVLSGVLQDPYTGKTIQFRRGNDTSADVQIDHVVALSDSWQKGAQHLTREQRVALANDPLELLAVDGPANQAKGDGDAATWLPPYKPFRCQYVARQIAVKAKYHLWMTQAEHDAIERILDTCPGQLLATARD